MKESALKNKRVGVVRIAFRIQNVSDDPVFWYSLLGEMISPHWYGQDKLRTDTCAVDQPREGFLSHVTTILKEYKMFY